MFLAAYFAERFTSSLVYVQGHPDTGGKPGFLAADESRGVWQMLPRDAEALALINDGRWKIPPNAVSWALLPPLAAPIGLRRDSASGVTAILMAPPRDCFALATPHQREGHYSLYLSLFGRTIKAGETASASARLVVAVSPSQSEILRLYRAYRSRRPPPSTTGCG